MKKYLKLRKHSLENMMDKSVTKASSFQINSSFLRKHVCQMPGGRPRGMLMPSPRGRDEIANAPPPGLTTCANAPRLPGGGMGTAGIDWCISFHYLFRATLYYTLWLCQFQARSYPSRAFDRPWSMITVDPLSGKLVNKLNKPSTAFTCRVSNAI